MKVEKVDHSQHMDIFRLFLFGILTHGLYLFHWWYKGLRYIKRYWNRKSNVLLKFLGLFVPFLNIYLTFEFFNETKNMLRGKGIRVLWSPGVRTLVLWAILIIDALAFGSGTLIHLLDYIFLVIVHIALVILLMIPFVSIQDSLNEYWDVTMSKNIKRKEFSKAEYIWMACGVVIWAIVIFSWVYLK